MGYREEIVPNGVLVKHAAISPEVLGVFEKMPLVFWNCYRYSFDNGTCVALALVAMMMSVQDAVDPGDADLPQKT